MLMSVVSSLSMTRIYLVSKPTNFNNLDHEGVYLRIRFGLIVLALVAPTSTLFYTHQKGKFPMLVGFYISSPEKILMDTTLPYSLSAGATAALMAVSEILTR